MDQEDFGDRYLDAHANKIPSVFQPDCERDNDGRLVFVASDPTAKYWILFNEEIGPSGRRLVVTRRQAPDDAPGIRQGLAAPGSVKVGCIKVALYSYAIRVVAWEGDAAMFNYIAPYSDMNRRPTETEIADAMAKAASVELTPGFGQSISHVIAEEALNCCKQR